MSEFTKANSDDKGSKPHKEAAIEMCPTIPLAI